MDQKRPLGYTPRAFKNISTHTIVLVVRLKMVSVGGFKAAVNYQLN